MTRLEMLRIEADLLSMDFYGHDRFFDEWLYKTGDGLVHFTPHSCIRNPVQKKTVTCIHREFPDLVVYHQGYKCIRKKILVDPTDWGDGGEG